MNNYAALRTDAHLHPRTQALLDIQYLPELGVGINFQKSLSSLLAKGSSLIDFVEFNPTDLCTWQERHDCWRLEPSDPMVEQFFRSTAGLPKVVHGETLSLGSVSGWNKAYLRAMDSVADREEIAWHSEHLGFLNVTTTDGEHYHAGSILPLPFCEESLNLLVPRIKALINRYQRPFLLENTAFYLPGIDGFGMDEVDFFNALAERVGEGFGILLDLYNFHCNAVNFNTNPWEKLAKLDKTRVVEVHLAGGCNLQGMEINNRSNHTPEPVWELLEALLPDATNLKALVFECPEVALGQFSETDVLRNLERANSHWRHRATRTQREVV
ncbi:DUF692 domain-containing protein [Teredinibacter turnerae]|uniref:DUF692 domain-containing protein n=1 Tax=Teredinibacter turnerae TaxID=2426 RepID=UPI0030CEED09